MKKLNVAVVGATGMVGKTFLKVLEERRLPIERLYLFASARSAGLKTSFNGKDHTIEELKDDSFDRGIDIALFSVESEESKHFAPIAASKGCVVIDNSSAWRMDENVPLVVPEVNAGDIAANKGIIANPNCSTIQAVVALKPIYDKYGIKRVVYSTYQSVSGAGVVGCTELTEGLKGNPPIKFPHQIADNCLPHIDKFTETGYTGEEIKMVRETRKILHDNDMRITATCCRVPVFVGHCVSVNVELATDFELDDLVQTLKNAPGIIIQNDHANNEYPMPLTAAGKDEVFVGRIRRDFSVKSGVNLWVVADNVRKGAATNAVQIAERLAAI